MGVSSVVIDCRATKQAALFFDHVIPYDGVEEFSRTGTDGTDGPIKDDEKAQRIITELLPPEFGTSKEVADFAFVASMGIVAITIAQGFYNCEPVDKQVEELLGKFNKPSGMKRHTQDNSPVSLPPDLYEHHDQDATPKADALLSIAQMQVPDGSALSWDHIIEFRKDMSARNRLRRLRVFAAKEYEGKPASFIEDDLCLRMEEYEQVLKEWNIKTVLSGLSTALSLESAIQVGIVDAVGVLHGVSSPTLLATSVAIPCGHFAIEFAKQRLERNKEVRGFPLAYLTDLQGLRNPDECKP